jgi:hypothetical protein
MARTRKPPTATPVSPPRPRLIRRTRAAAPNEPATVSHELIARQAYWLFLERGCVHGHDLDDWLTAERELLEPRSESMARRAAG